MSIPAQILAGIVLALGLTAFGMGCVYGPDLWDEIMAALKYRRRGP
jgi:hypothetical protein